jgi:hypothetical protein
MDGSHPKEQGSVSSLRIYNTRSTVQEARVPQTSSSSRDTIGGRPNCLESLSLWRVYNTRSTVASRHGEGKTKTEKISNQYRNRQFNFGEIYLGVEGNSANGLKKSTTEGFSHYGIVSNPLRHRLSTPSVALTLGKNRATWQMNHPQSYLKKYLQHKKKQLLAPSRAANSRFGRRQQLEPSIEGDSYIGQQQVKPSIADDLRIGQQQLSPSRVGQQQLAPSRAASSRIRQQQLKTSIAADSHIGQQQLEPSIADEPIATSRNADQPIAPLIGDEHIVQQPSTPMLADKFPEEKYTEEKKASPLKADEPLHNFIVAPSKTDEPIEQQRVALSRADGPIPLLSNAEKQELRKEIKLAYDSSSVSNTHDARRFWAKMRELHPNNLFELEKIQEYVAKVSRLEKKKSKRKQKIHDDCENHPLATEMKKLNVASNVKDANVKDVEMLLQELYEKCKYITDEGKGSRKAFWVAFQYHVPHVYHDKLPARVQYLILNKKRQENNAMGIGRNGKIKVYRKRFYVPQPIMTKAEENKQGHFGARLPFLTRGWFHSHVDALYCLNVKLKEALLNSTKETSNNAHHGVSLGKTVVSGGRHANKDLGISGSIHWNNALREKQALQLEVFVLVEKIVTASFGECTWFKRWMAFFDKNPRLKRFLIHNTPFTSVWWSYDDRPWNLHHDWDTYGAACLVCLDDVKGGNIIVMNPEGTRSYSIHMSKGKIICGRWALSKHCNAPVLEGKKRHSMVFYCDSRMMTGANYKGCFLTHATEILNQQAATYPTEGVEICPEESLDEEDQAGLEYDGFVPPDLVLAMSQAALGTGARVCGR